MRGSDLIDELARRASKRLGVQTLSDAAMARELGVTTSHLNRLRSQELTPSSAAAFIEKHSQRAVQSVIEDAVKPIVEFFYLDKVETKQGANWRLFATKDENNKEKRYLSALRQKLTESYGIYIFHDSRGRAIYSGKAERQSLWDEMNLAFNRDRGEVQFIKRAYHPTIKGTYSDGGRIKIARESVVLAEIASYVSAYAVADGLIGKLEALIVRSFANDLLNVRMETF